MSIASTNSYRPTIDSIVRDAMILSGTMHTQASLGDQQFKHDASYCRRLLADICHELIASGVILRWTEFRTFTTTDGTGDYTLDTDVQDVLQTVMYQRDSNAGWNYVRIIADEDWQRLTAKDAEGTPTQVLPIRHDNPIILRLWPIPDTTGATVRYKAHVTPADVDDGSKQLDVDDWWRNYLKKRLAADFSQSKGILQQANLFRSEAEMQFARNMNKSQPRATMQASVGHRTGWNRRR